MPVTQPTYTASGPSTHPPPVAEIPKTSTDPSQSDPSSPPNSSICVGPSSTSNPLKPPSRPPSFSALFPPLVGNTSSAITSALPTSSHPGQLHQTGQHHFTNFGESSSTSMSSGETSQRVPEKCWTFCSQGDGGQSMCRMFCFRRREPALDRATQLARLRPPPKSRSSMRAAVSEHDETSSITARPELLSASSSSTLSSSFWSSLRSPFETLRKTVEPYSFIYVKGTFEGVVGRYMEELEYDDGQQDFGAVSRAAKKREDSGIERLDWGEHGTLIHLPFSSIFHPIISIPRTVQIISGPPLAFISKYIESFRDGTQQRSFDRFTTELYRGGAQDVLEKMHEHYEKKALKLQEERDAKLGLGKDANANANANASGKGSGSGRQGVEVGKEVEVGKGE